MPHVNPRSSSPPPVSGKAEDKQHLEKSDSNQVKIESSVIDSKTKPENPLYQSVILPHSVFPGQPGILGEVDDGRAEPSTNYKILDEDSRGDVQTLKKSRDEVIKEIGISSTAFIGPVYQPKVSIEKELSEFYKELEEIDNQDTSDGVTGGNEVLAPPCIPNFKPPPGKERKEREQKNAYRPYPTSGSHGCSQTDHSWRWRPPSHNNVTWDHSVQNQKQWQHPMPSFPQGPSRFDLHGPPNYFPCPPPRNPMHLLCSEPQVNYSSSDSSSWGLSEGTEHQLGYNVRFPSSDHSGTFAQYEGNHPDLRRYDEQNYREEDRYWPGNSRSLVVILLRGLPGSGKSTLAKEILSSAPSGLILSTDDYFFDKDGYFFDPTLLGEAHDWNHKRAREAMLDGCSPVIIDNTNVQAWEMKPYVAMALECGYRVEFAEPNTSWKCDPVALEMRNKHRVPRETIAKMLDRFELPMSVDIVMNSTEPAHKSKERVSRPYRQKTFDYT